MLAPDVDVAFAGVERPVVQRGPDEDAPCRTVRRGLTGPTRADASWPARADGATYPVMSPLERQQRLSAWVPETRLRRDGFRGVLARAARLQEHLLPPGLPANAETCLPPPALPLD